MDIKELYIGNMVQNKSHKFPMRVVGLFASDTVYLDFDGKEGDMREEYVKDLE